MDVFKTMSNDKLCMELNKMALECFDILCSSLLEEAARRIERLEKIESEIKSMIRSYNV